MTHTKLPKLLLLLLSYCAFMFLEACQPVCPDFVILPYMTFESANATPNALVFDESSEDFSIEIEFDGVEFVALNVPTRSTWLSTSMYGCRRAPDGQNGFKNPLIAIDLTALEDFDVEHPAGNLLNDLFELQESLSDEYISLKTLIAEGRANEIFILGKESRSFIMKEAFPTNAGAYNFKVKLVFENGDPIELTLEPITFN